MKHPIGDQSLQDLLSRLQAALADRYRLERELGRGGMATVYLARELKHDRPVALKLLHPDLAAALGTDRFLREVRLTASLQHPRILTVLDSGEAAGQLWYTMPYVDGESLRDRLRREKQLPLEDAVRIAKQVLAALAHAHSRGVIHRDIKPENILLSRSGDEAVVADFGIARAISVAGEERLTQTGLAVGTPTYMSPEQASGQHDIDGRSDLYSVGCVLYEMLAGEPPYTGPTAQAIMAKRMLEPLPHVHTVRESVPPTLEDVVARALAKVPADRYRTASEFADALAVPLGPAPSPRLRPLLRSRGAWLALLAAAAILLIVAALYLRPARSVRLDPDLIAVAPFDVLDPRLGLWHEGLVDLLSRSLDGAGPLRTVSPSTVIRRWRGRADPASAELLGRSTGARLAIIGSLIGSGPDSVRLSASLLDIASQRALIEVDLRGDEQRMDGLVDSLALTLVRGLGQSRPIGAVSRTALGTASLPALKAFLQGEQLFRRTAWDSAIAAYTQAISLDSTFAPAFRQLGRALGWQRIGGDSLAIANQLRAGTLNHGLAPRDSLLLSADSLLAGLFTETDTLWWPHTRKLFATLGQATQRYPDDPDAWYGLGEARFHFGAIFGVTLAEQLGAFDRAIALDSSFDPAYIHPVELGLQAGGRTLGQRYIDAYLARHPTDVNAAGISLAARLIAARQSQVPDELGRLDTLSADPIFFAWYAVMRWPDLAETGVRLARAFSRARRSQYAGFADTLYRAFVLGRELAFRGHWREASEVLRATSGDPPSRLFTEMALQHMVPPERAAAVFEHWRTRPVPLLDRALPWWGTRGDTVTLGSAWREADSAARSAKTSDERGAWAYSGAVALAYLTLARRDTTGAISRLLTLPDSLCQGCYLPRLTLIDLLAARSRLREAASILERLLPGDEYPHASDALWDLERGRIEERLARREPAVNAYRSIAAIWQNADPELQPYVREARDGLKRLADAAGD